MLNKLLATLFSKMHFTVSSAPDRVTPADQIVAFTHEVATFGYTFDAELLAKLAGLSQSAFNVLRQDVLGFLAEVTGAGSAHNVLFKKFPYSTPDQHEYLIKRIVGYVENAFGFTPGQARVLSCGHVIDTTMFNLDEFGACPICQHQVDELSGEAEQRYDFQRATPLKVLSYVGKNDVARLANALLARNSSLSQQEVDFVRAAGDYVGLSAPASIFRETLPLAYSLFGDQVAALVTTATDVLRLATSFSGPDADLSLKENVRFKFNARQRKDLMLMLASVARKGGMAEDLMRYRERWLRVGERLHVGAAGNRNKYPQVAAAFDTLRNQPGAIKTFNRKVETKVCAQVIDNDLLKLLESRPGEFARRLDFLLRTAHQPQAVVDSFATAVSGLPTKMLFELRKYFVHRPEATGAERVIFPKGKVNKMQAIPDHRKAIDHRVLDQVDQVIGAELTSRLAKAEPMGKVFIDGALDEIVLPFNRRGDSATSTNVIKGARYGFDPQAPVLRFFVHWTGYIDVDLSALFYADDLSVVGQVSFTNLQWKDVVVHSGDIQSAPNGASEFIDVDIAKAIQRGVRYVAMSVISFRGQAFNSFPCYAGYMERDALRSGKAYQPETLALKFDVNTPNTTHMPLMFDLVERKAVFIDMAAGGRSRSHVMGQSKALTALLRSVIDMPKAKPTVGDVLRAHVAARGALAQNEQEADLVFKASGLDLDAVLAMTQ